MELKKIKSVKHDFHEKMGPSETITLGFQCDDEVFILGTYYYGPGMAKGINEHAEKIEKIIDYICSKKERRQYGRNHI